MMRIALIAVAAATLLTGRGEAQEPPSPADAAFAAWTQTYKTQAAARGLDPATLDSVLTGLRYSPRVVELDRAQPDDSGQRAVFANYLARRLDESRIDRGRQVKSDLGAALRDAESRYGVPAEIILGIWGMESSYGAVTGDFDVPRSVASLAYDGRRRELFTRELDASVRIIQEGRARRDQLKGSWAGAMGQPQFLPSSYLADSADGDGDGRADIWNSPPDVAASIANYLARRGWQRGQPWGMAVAVPAGLDRQRVRDLVLPTQCVRPLSRHSRWLTVGEWKTLGLLPVGRGWPADDVLATLVEPDGPGQAAYLTFGNYRALMAYNCSNFYALSVALLGDALQ